MSYHTQKGYQKSTIRVFIMVVSALVGLGLGYVLFKSYRLYQERDFWKMDQFFFTVTTQFDQYQSAVLGLIDNSLNYPSCKPAQCLVNAKQQQKKLIDVLNEATKRYHNVRLTAVIIQFRQWQHQHNILHSTLSQATLSHWSMHFGDHQYAIYKVLREIVGFYNIDSRDAAKTMWLVPRAEQALKNHPDDPHLCTVMQHSLVNTAPRIAAQQIAFMRLGEKYCAHYYHQPRAWGISRDTLALHGSRHNHYARLPYVLYYKHYVAPLSKRLYPTLRKKDWQKICWHLPPMDNQRDPLQDAKRLIWQRYHRQHCGTLEQRDYMRTAQFCLRYVRYTCPNDQHCDAVERCKLTPGILFTNTF